MSDYILRKTKLYNVIDMLFKVTNFPLKKTLKLLTNYIVGGKNILRDNSIMSQFV